MAALRSSLRHCRLFTTATTTPSLTKQVLTTHEVKEKFRSETDADKALELYKDLSSNADVSPFASRFALDIIVRRLAQARRFSEIETLIDSHKKHPKITQESFLFGLIRAYGVAHMVDHASRLFDQMEELGTPRTTISFNALLTAYNLSRRSKHVPKLFDEIRQKHGITPDVVSYNILIQSYCALKSNSAVDAALGVLKKMEEENVEKGSITYTLILHALYRKKRVEKADRMWSEMLEKGCKPDVHTYNVRIMHARGKKPEDVLALIEEMKKAGVEPDTMTYNHLFTCYSKNGMMDEAMKLFESLEEKGCYRSAVTFEICVIHLCGHAKFDKAYEVFKEGAMKNKLPHFAAVKGLYRGLVKNSKTMEAEELVTIVKKKFSTEQLESLKEQEAAIEKGKESELEEKLGSSKGEESPEEETTAASA